MSTKHTPGQITVKRGQFGSSVFVLYGQDGFPIAQTISNSSPEGMERARRGEHEANAHRLALCWNTHAELLEAAQLVLKGYGVKWEDAALRDLLAAAVAKATA